MFLSVCLQRPRFTGLLLPKGGRFTLLVMFPNTTFQRILARITRLRGLRDLPWLIALPYNCLSSSSWRKTVENLHFSHSFLLLSHVAAFWCQLCHDRGAKEVSLIWHSDRKCYPSRSKQSVFFALHMNQRASFWTYV